MTIAFVSSKTATSGNADNGSVTITAPTGVAAGMLLIAYVPSSVTAPSGWTAIPSVPGAWSKVATASEPASYMFSQSHNTWISGAVLAYSGASGVDVSASGTATSSPSVTTGHANEAVIFGNGGWSGALTESTSASVTQRAAVTNGSNAGVSLLIVDFIEAAAAAAPTATWTNGNENGFTIALKPTFTAPNAPTGVTPNGTTLDRTVTQRIAWTYSNTNPSDGQSQFDIQWRHQGSSDAWNTISQTTPNAYYDAPSGTFPAEGIEYQVRTYDQGGLASPWSALTTFTAADPTGTPTITAPLSGGTIGLTPSTVSWSASAQQAYQVRTVADDGTGNPNTAVVYTDTGQVTDATTRSVQVAYSTNNIVVHTQVRVEQNSLWSSWADITDTVSYTPPATPTVATTADGVTGTITVTPTQPAPAAGEPTVTAIDIWCRTSDTSPVVDLQRPRTTGVRLVAGLPPTTAWTDWAPASGVIYEYQVIAYGSNTTTAASAWTA